MSVKPHDVAPLLRAKVKTEMRLWSRTAHNVLHMSLFQFEMLSMHRLYLLLIVYGILGARCFPQASFSII